MGKYERKYKRVKGTDPNLDPYNASFASSNPDLVIIAVPLLTELQSLNPKNSQKLGCVHYSSWHLIRKFEINFIIRNFHEKLIIYCFLLQETWRQKPPRGQLHRHRRPELRQPLRRRRSSTSTVRRSPVPSYRPGRGNGRAPRHCLAVPWRRRLGGHRGQVCQRWAPRQPTRPRVGVMKRKAMRWHGWAVISAHSIHSSGASRVRQPAATSVKAEWATAATATSLNTTTTMAATVAEVAVANPPRWWPFHPPNWDRVGNCQWARPTTTSTTGMRWMITTTTTLLTTLFVRIHNRSRTIWRTAAAAIRSPKFSHWRTATSARRNPSSHRWDAAARGGRDFRLTRRRRMNWGRSASARILSPISGGSSEHRPRSTLP